MRLLGYANRCNVFQSQATGSITVEWTGNGKDSTLQDVRAAADKIMFLGFFSRLQENKIWEQGNPRFLYTLVGKPDLDMIWPICKQ